MTSCDVDGLSILVTPVRFTVLALGSFSALSLRSASSKMH